MKAQEIRQRRDKIIEILQSKKFIRVSDLKDLFEVSDETIRKDFEFLEKKGILKKVHGGAELNEVPPIEPVNVRTSDHYKEKMAIVEKAMAFITPDQTVLGLDKGSTIGLLASLLAKETGKIIMTNSLLSLIELMNSTNETYCTGGKFTKEDMSFNGSMSIHAINNVQLDISFLGTSGVKNHNGICSTIYSDIDFKTKLIERSSKKIVLMDYTKFHKSSFAVMSAWENIDIVITNSNAPKEQIKDLEKKTQVILV